MTKKTEISFDRTLFRAGDRVCIALSGGADSVALLLALREANATKEPLGIVLSALHVHHGLREAADADQAFVRELCARLNIPLTVERVDVAARQAAEREGLEEAARELRYAAFWRQLSAANIDAIATAHTLDDQAETVMMKILRGAWTEGIGGIAPVLSSQPQSGAVKSQGRILRPLLAVHRAHIESFLNERAQPWREDETNRDLSLTRNRVRHELMPMLRSFNPEVDRALARLAEIARDEESFWQTEIARVLPPLLLPGRPVRGGGRAVSTVPNENAFGMEIERLRALAPALRRRVLRSAVRQLGVRLSADETARILALAGFGGFAGVTGRIGSRLEFRDGLQVERTARELRISRVTQGP
jgi:tRNA(Ile)-lysidine synthase